MKKKKNTTNQMDSNKNSNEKKYNNTIRQRTTLNYSEQFNKS